MSHETVALPNFGVPGQSGRMCIVRGGQTYRREQALRRGLKALGGLEAFIRKGDRVLLKVNAAFAMPPLLGATTDPVLVSELCRMCLKSGAADVIVTDNPINDPASCFNLSGIEAAAREAGGRVVYPGPRPFTHINVRGATLLGDRWWQLRGWPVNWFVQLDPLVGLGTLLSTGTLYAGLLWGLVTLILTMVLGRFFCGWVCPFGTLQHGIGYWAHRGRPAAERIRLNRYHPAQILKYGVLILLLAAASACWMHRIVGLPAQQPLVWCGVVAAGLVLIGLLGAAGQWDFKRCPVSGLTPIGPLLSLT